MELTEQMVSRGAGRLGNDAHQFKRGYRPDATLKRNCARR
jgi:hypothetical protein